MGSKIFTIGLAVFGLIFFITAQGYSEAQHQYVSSATFPSFVAALLVICTLILLVKQILIDKNNKDKEKQKEEGVTYRGLIIIVLMIIFYFVLPWAGFFIAGSLITMVFAYMLQTERIKKFDTFIYPFIVSAVIILFFNTLKIYLPSGFFF